MKTVIDYNPFGAEHQNPEIGTQPKPCYRYSGKEEAESYYQYSPYTYCANNPTNLIDPDGERIVVSDYFSSKTESDNIYEWTNETGEW